MRILVAPQELKGTLTSEAAAAALVRGISRGWPAAECDVLPLSDGGPGFVSAALSAVPNAQRRTTRVQDALGGAVDAAWAFVPSTPDAPATALLEMAAASGLSLLPESRRRPMDASTFGTGELLLAAIDAGARRVVLGLGGSATTDGGAGALQALGCRLLDAEGAPLARGGGALGRAASLDVSGVDARVRDVAWELATDVDSPLLGPIGSARRFAPQKGATQEQVEVLENGLSHFAALLESAVGAQVSRVHARRLGAAGGLAFGLSLVLDARVSSGFERVRALSGLDARLQHADVVVTAEGRLDAQTLAGKGPGALCALAKSVGKSTVFFAGQLGAGVVDGADANAAAAEDSAGTIRSRKTNAHDANDGRVLRHAFPHIDELVCLSQLAPTRARAEAANVLAEAAEAWARRCARTHADFR